MAGPTRHIAGFDALRAFSVSLVILSHTQVLLWAAGSSSIGARLVSVFNADFGVKTFFVLSGFLITSLLAAEHERTGEIGILAFVARRCLRILPLYFIVVVFAADIMIAGFSPPVWTALAYSVLYSYNFLPLAETTSFLNHLWSLSVEEQFYIFWPLALTLLFGARRIAINVFVLAAIAACFVRIATGYGDLEKSYSPALWTIPAIMPIMVGAGVALNIRSLGPVLRSPFALAICLALICTPLWLADSAAREFAVDAGLAGAVGWIYLNQSSGFVRNMDFGPIGYIGEISYGLYMWQGVFTGNGPFRDPLSAWPPPMWVGALLILPVAMLSYHFVETPIREIGRERGRR